MSLRDVGNITIKKFSHCCLMMYYKFPCTPFSQPVSSLDRLSQKGFFATILYGLSASPEQQQDCWAP